MNYEKKYKEAQKWIESIYSELSHEQQMEAEAFFPELKESEDVDKKIREEIIATIHLYYGKPLEDEAKEMIAWLEKQEGCEYIKKDWLEHIKQSWYKEGFIDGKYSGGTSKEWTINDAAIFKEIIDFLENGTAKLQHDLTKYANWLKIQFTPIEKQGRQFSVDKLKPKFHEGEWITNGDYTWKIVDVKPLDYILQSQDGNIVDDTISHVDEQFHSFTIKDAKDGDVLACPLPKGYEAGEQIFIFKEINSRDYVENCIEYYCRVCEGEFYENETGYMGTTSSPIYPATKEQRDTLMKAMADAGWGFDFEKKELKKIEQKYTTMSLDEAIEHCKEKSCGNNACALEHKQLERWLTELKKLKEHKPAWSEEDTFMYNKIKNLLTDISLAPESRNSLFDWLKSLKDRVQPKQEWNKGDMEMLNAAISFVEHSSFTTIGKGKNNTVAWLKSLKSRVIPQSRQEWSKEDETKMHAALAFIKSEFPKEGNEEFMEDTIEWLKSLRPQKQWKPSKGQLECLGYAIDKAEKDYSPLANNRIYLTLKALKKELEKLTE